MIYTRLVNFPSIKRNLYFQSSIISESINLFIITMLTCNLGTAGATEMGFFALLNLAAAGLY